ncbi:hypothetical protein BBW65_06975 [Helicobacter enhydrae]|uniref:Uncharacterized protein n=1 Tax=Helicobacter enhydrae TaxID=222136 RepID=A0A1B1U751_9HELI|nr:hypothetical protein [Helicobacter enhydrae]ANV98551.1 hypothetical protein BBW65_06975 [Helicobacter enhydrae]
MEDIDSGMNAKVISCVITQLPKPPTSKEPDCFDERADAFLESLPTLVEEMNTVGEQVNEFLPKLESEGEKIAQKCELKAQKVAEKIEQIKEDAKREIASIVTARSGMLKESAMRTYLLALSVREIVMKNRRNYERVGEVREFRGSEVGGGYVRLPAQLSVVEYPLLARALGVRSGEFVVNGKEGEKIYTGKGE